MSKKDKLKDYMVDRDVSWMYFNHRILDEAKKEELPLLERLSFLGIYSNNLDEFFRVRVASLGKVVDSDKASKKERAKYKETIKQINALNKQYNREYAQTTEQVFALLAEKHKIRLLNETQLNEEQQAWVRRYYYDALNGYTNPIWLSEIKDISDLEDNRIYLVVRKTEVGEKKAKYALVMLPDRECGRFVRIPSSEGFENVMFLDDVVRFCLPLIFCGFKQSSFEAYSFKFTKDAEMEMENEADYGMMEKIAQGVDSRRHGDPSRVIYDRDMPREVRKRIIKKLHVKYLETELASGRYQNNKDLSDFPDCGKKGLKYEKWPQVVKPEFTAEESLLDLVRKKDRFIHMPFQSFDGYIRLLREAATKPEVKEIKTTLYRLAKNSKVVNALICAARNGKKVTAVIELMASFDEESNVAWAKAMHDAGIKVIYGVEGLKVHSKLLWIESKKGNIACVGTGNFHEKNAKRYTDYLMMTARRSIVNDVERVFDFIDRPYSNQHFRHLLVSPNAMKNRIINMLETEMANAKAGKEAWVRCKMNHLTEEDVVEKLYEASQAGVKIELMVRSNCALVPGIPGVSENIKVVGIIDRFLEHARLLIFCNGGKPKVYMGSADWMPRNLLNRIEVMAPVLDEEMKADIMRTVDYGLRDTTNGRLVTGDGDEALQAGEPFRSQEELFKAYQE